MWRKLEPRDFEKLLRSSGSFQAVAAQVVVEQMNQLMLNLLHIDENDARAVQVIDKIVIIETDQSPVSAEIRLHETLLLDNLRAKGVEVTGFRFRARRGTRN